MSGTQVVVVGGGFAGLSAAARIAKQRHKVTLLEAGERLGGRLQPHVVGTQSFALCTPHVTLPGVFRDLFRKSGRTMDRALGFEPIAGRSHYFHDEPPLHLPTGNRGGQIAAMTDRFGDDFGWSDWLDTMPGPWDLVRRVALDRVTRGRTDFSRSQWRSLHPRRRLKAQVQKSLVSERARQIAIDRHIVEGRYSPSAPALAALIEYVERNFGLWAFEGGPAGLASALETRLKERKVEVRMQTRAAGLVFDGARLNGVLTESETLDADIVVWCAPPPPGHVSREVPARPAARTFLVLDEVADDLPLEAVVHADQPIRMYRIARNVTLEHRGNGDVLDVLNRCGLDVRGHVLNRHEVSSVELGRATHWGYTWSGTSAALSLPGVDPRGGLFFAGAHAHPGGTLEQIGMATAAISTAIGTAPR